MSREWYAVLINELIDHFGNFETWQYIYTANFVIYKHQANVFLIQNLFDFLWFACLGRDLVFVERKNASLVLHR